MAIKLHVKVFETLLQKLEELVSSELLHNKKRGVTKVGGLSNLFSGSDSRQIPNYSVYFGVRGNKNNIFGNVLQDLVINAGYEGVYSKRQLAKAYSEYSKYKREEGASSWVKISKNYVQVYLDLLNAKRGLIGDDKGWDWERLLKESGLRGKELKEQEGCWRLAVGQKAKARYYLLAYVSWGEDRKRLKYALMEFSVVPGERNTSGSVSISKTSSGSDYKGEYKLLRQGREFSENVLKITLQSERRPLFILLNKKRETPFAGFSFLIGNFVFIDKGLKNVQGAVFLERLKGVSSEELKKLKHDALKGLSSLKEYDKLLLYSHLSHLNETDVLPESAFEDLEELRETMKGLHVWWSGHKKLLNEVFSAEQDTWCFYLYFLGKRGRRMGGGDGQQGRVEKFLVRYPMCLKKTGDVHIWGAGGTLRYKGVYRAELEDALSMKVESPPSVDKPNYFHLFFRKRGNGCLQGLYAGWVRKTSGLKLFSGEIVAVPVNCDKWNKKRGKLFSLDPDMTKIEEPEWRREITDRYDAVLPYLLGLKSFSSGNGLALLPGILPVYERGALHSDLEGLAGVYYYYRTRTRPGRQYTVKAYAVLIDEQGFVYVKSSKDNKRFGRKDKVELLYRGSLVRVERKHAGEWSAVAVLEKTGGDFGGVLIIERPTLTSDLSLQYDMRGIHLSLNYYGDPIAGRVYFVRKSEKVDWEEFKQMKSPEYFVQHYDKDKGTLHWHVSNDLKNDVEEIGDKVIDEALSRLLNRLCGQINNFLSFRRKELEARTNIVVNAAGNPSDEIFYPALFKGSYAEDVLRAALAYWREGYEKRFQEAFLTAVLCGGYSDIVQLRKLFVENEELKEADLEGIKIALNRLPDMLRNSRDVRPEKRSLRLKLILDKMFENMK